MGYAYGFGYGHTWRGSKRVTAAAAVGGAALLTGEADGWATDFTYPVDAQRVALKASGATTSYPLDGFISSLGTSPKMVYDVSGVLGWSPHNMHLQSQTFDNVYWFKSNVTAGANAATAPDGTLTADAVIPNSGSVATAFGNNSPIAVISGATYTYSMYAKAGTLAGTNWFYVGPSGSATVRAWFNLATGVKGSTTALSSTMTSVGNGWYRITATFLSDAATFTSYNGASPADSSTGAITGDGVSPVFYIWGTQLNRGSVALPYLPTTTLVRCGVAVDYDPVTHAPRGMWAEPAATNLLLQSSDFNTIWNKSNTTIGVNSTTAPDGSATADKILDDTTAATNHTVYQGAVLTAAAYTLSAYFKAAERSWGILCLAPTIGSGNAWFNLATGALGTVAGGTTAAMVSVGNGWYRCSITLTATAATHYSALGTAPADNMFNYAGNGTGIYVWGAQLETGTVASSHIPTLAASVTRAYDYNQITPTQINYSATAGSWWLKVKPLYTNTDPQFIRHGNGLATPLNPAGTAVLLYSPPGSLYSANWGVPAFGTTVKIMSAFQANDWVIAANGTTPATTTAYSSTNLLNPGASIVIGGVGANLQPGYYEQVRYLPRRPTNTEVQAMTT